MFEFRVMAVKRTSPLTKKKKGPALLNWCLDSVITWSEINNFWVYCPVSHNQFMVPVQVRRLHFMFLLNHRVLIYRVVLV